MRLIRQRGPRGQTGGHRVGESRCVRCVPSCRPAIAETRPFSRTAGLSGRFSLSLRRGSGRTSTLTGPSAVSAVTLRSQLRRRPRGFRHQVLDEGNSRVPGVCRAGTPLCACALSSSPRTEDRAVCPVRPRWPWRISLLWSNGSQPPRAPASGHRRRAVGLLSR